MIPLPQTYQRANAAVSRLPTQVLWDGERDERVAQRLAQLVLAPDELVVGELRICVDQVAPARPGGC